ncbi:MAG: hypothetical protein U0787_08010 [Polyangia bacterium]
MKHRLLAAEDLKLGQQRFDSIGDLNHIGTGLPLDVEDDRAIRIGPSGKLRIFDASTTFATSLGQSESPRRFVRQHQRGKGRGAIELIIGCYRL